MESIRPHIPSLCGLGDWTWVECFPPNAAGKSQISMMLAEEFQANKILSDFLGIKTDRRFRRFEYLSNGVPRIGYQRIF